MKPFSSSGPSKEAIAENLFMEDVREAKTDLVLKKSVKRSVQGCIILLLLLLILILFTPLLLHQLLPLLLLILPTVLMLLLLYQVIFDEM